jgi:prefoldin subunit 5
VTYPEDELSQLGAQANWLQEQLDLIQQRMDELKGRATSETQSNTEA